LTDIDLLNRYLEFCDYRKVLNETERLDLSEATFFRPTTLLPLCNLVSERRLHPRQIEYPEDENAAGYMLTILHGSVRNKVSNSYIPAVNLPKDPKECESLLQRIYRLQEEDESICGGEQPYKYVIKELVDNIYEHSCFTDASAMAQKYPNLGFVELCFCDNGITIPTNYERHGLRFTPIDAIREAINGLSTKEEKTRGFGIRTSIRLFVDGLDGEFFVVSGAAAIYLTRRYKLGINLTKDNQLSGTLVSLKVPYPASLIPTSEFYRYVG